MKPTKLYVTAIEAEMLMQWAEAAEQAVAVLINITSACATNNCGPVDLGGLGAAAHRAILECAHISSLAAKIEKEYQGGTDLTAHL